MPTASTQSPKKSNPNQTGTSKNRPTGNLVPTPIPQCMFTVKVEGTPQTFTQAAIALAINLAKKELILVVEQSASNQEHVTIQDMIDNPGRDIDVDLLDGNGNILEMLKYTNCKVVDHLVTMDYGNISPMWHDVKFEYDTFVPKSGTATATKNAFNSAMSIVGKRSTP